jgi:hypothetical protein
VTARQADANIQDKGAEIRIDLLVQVLQRAQDGSSRFRCCCKIDVRRRAVRFAINACRRKPQAEPALGAP